MKKLQRELIKTLIKRELRKHDCCRQRRTLSGNESLPGDVLKADNAWKTGAGDARCMESKAFHRCRISCRIAVAPATVTSWLSACRSASAALCSSTYCSPESDTAQTTHMTACMTVRKLSITNCRTDRRKWNYSVFRMYCVGRLRDMTNREWVWIVHNVGLLAQTVQYNRPNSPCSTNVKPYLPWKYLRRILMRAFDKTGCK